MTIRVANVTKQFGDFYALNDVSVDIPSGSLTALLGPSGGGKSTLLRVIAGLEQPDSGTVEISGHDLTSTPPQGRNVGFVFQHYAAFKHLTVARNVAFGLEIRKRPKAEVKKRVQELLELVHLENFADRYPAQLSGGQRQRMALARALAVEPRVLLLDEPFGALDAQVRKELRTWLRRLHDEVHVTTVFVTHDQEEAMDVADRIFVMANGKVEQEGSPDELYDKPANDFVMSFLGPATRLDGELVRPHDVELLADAQPGAIQAHISRIVRLGFEVRVELTEDGASQQATRAGLAAAVDAAESAGTPPVAAQAGSLWAQLTREELQRLGVGAGDPVFARPARRTLAKAV
jgi:sulfate transport system ATP-binding protein